MRKIFLLLIFMTFIGIGTTNAQCTPVPFSSGLTNPDTTQGIPPAVETQAYFQVIHIRIPKDTLVNGFKIKIDSVGILNIAGMPTSMSWATNTVSNYWPGNSFGCLIIQGTPAVGDAKDYKVSVTLEVKAFGNGMPYTLKYKFKVLDASHIGIDLSNRSEFQLMQNKPNPFGNQTSISFYMPKAQVVDFKVYDIIGNCIINEKHNANKSKNTIVLSKGDLPSGIYIYEINTGKEIVRKRMIIK